jgi:hypothetical protein
MSSLFRSAGALDKPTGPVNMNYLYQAIDFIYQYLSCRSRDDKIVLWDRLTAKPLGPEPNWLTGYRFFTPVTSGLDNDDE